MVTQVQGRFDLSERRVCRFLDFERTAVSYKRVERLYRLAGLAVRRRSRKRLAVPRVPRPVVEAPNETWSIGFVSDGLSSGRRFRCFTLIDACTREAPSITVALGLPRTATSALAGTRARGGLSLPSHRAPNRATRVWLRVGYKRQVPTAFGHRHSHKPFYFNQLPIGTAGFEPATP